MHFNNKQCELQSEVEMYHIPRPTLTDNTDDTYASYMRRRQLDKQSSGGGQVRYLPDSGQIVRVVSSTRVPKEVLPDGEFSHLFFYQQISLKLLQSSMFYLIQTY